MYWTSQLTRSQIVLYFLQISRELAKTTEPRQTCISICRKLVKYSDRYWDLSRLQSQDNLIWLNINEYIARMKYLYKIQKIVVLRKADIQDQPADSISECSSKCIHCWTWQPCWERAGLALSFLPRRKWSSQHSFWWSVRSSSFRTPA